LRRAESKIANSLPLDGLDGLGELGELGKHELALINLVEFAKRGVGHWIKKHATY
jgi:hypothetical protein